MLKKCLSPPPFLQLSQLRFNPFLARPCVPTQRKRNVQDMFYDVQIFFCDEISTFNPDGSLHCLVLANCACKAAFDAAFKRQYNASAVLLLEGKRRLRGMELFFPCATAVRVESFCNLGILRCFRVLANTVGVQSCELNLETDSLQNLRSISDMLPRFRSLLPRTLSIRMTYHGTLVSSLALSLGAIMRAVHGSSVSELVLILEDKAAKYVYEDVDVEGLIYPVALSSLRFCFEAPFLTSTVLYWLLQDLPARCEIITQFGKSSSNQIVRHLCDLQSVFTSITQGRRTLPKAFAVVLSGVDPVLRHELRKCYLGLKILLQPCGCKFRMVA